MHLEKKGKDTYPQANQTCYLLGVFIVFTFFRLRKVYLLAVFPTSVQWFQSIAGLEKLRARSCPCMYDIHEKTCTQTISQLENYPYCFTKMFFAVKD